MRRDPLKRTLIRSLNKDLIVLRCLSLFHCVIVFCFSLLIIVFHRCFSLVVIVTPCFSLGFSLFSFVFLCFPWFLELLEVVLELRELVLS